MFDFASAKRERSALPGDEYLFVEHVKNDKRKGCLRFDDAEIGKVESEKGHGMSVGNDIHDSVRRGSRGCNLHIFIHIDGCAGLKDVEGIPHRDINICRRGRNMMMVAA